MPLGKIDEDYQKLSKQSVGNLISKAQSHAKKGEKLKARELYELVLKDFPKNKRARLGLASIVADSNTIMGSYIPQSILNELVNLYSDREFRKVTEKIENLLSLYSSGAIPWEIFGAAAAQIGNLDQAIFAFKNAISIDPKNPEMHYNLGTAYQQAGKLDSAEDAFSAAINLKPDHVLALNNIGTVFKEKAMFDQAVEVYQKAIKINPNYALAYNNLGVALAEKEKFSEAIIAYKKAITIRANYFEAHYNLAFALKKIRHFDASIEASKQALIIMPEFPEAMINIGNVLQEQGKLAEALEWFQRAVKISPHQASAYFNMGNVLCDQKIFSDAVMSYKNALRIKPDYVEAYHNLGRAYALQGRLDEAFSSFSEALKIKPDYADAYNGAGNCLKEQGKLDDAIELYEIAQKFKPDYADAYFNHGIAMQLKGELTAAIMLYQKATMHKPEYFEAYFNQGLTLMMQGKHSEATVSLKTAISLKPDDPDAHKHLGNAFLAIKDFASAINSYDAAIDLNPLDAETYCNLGAALKDLGEYDQASEAFKNVLAIQPNNSTARNNLGKIYWLKQNFARAFELMEWRWEEEENLLGSMLETSKPTWQGEEGSEVFVWKEQGIGDEILFSSMFVELRDVNEKLIVECDKRLRPLFERSFPKNISFIDDRSDLSDTEYTNQIAAASLLKHFRKELSDFKQSASGWLKADTQLKSNLREKLVASETDKLIGISWFTNSAGGTSQRRNIPLDILMRYLERVPGKFVTLQYGDTAEEILQLNNETGIEVMNVAGLDLFNDIDGLAALISACDTVVTVDNLTVHLAGALGVDTKLLLPAISDVRWGLTSNSSYLYDRVKLYRQTVQNKWDAQLDHLVADLIKI